MTATKFFPNPDANTPDNSTFGPVSDVAKPVAHVVHPLPGDTLGDIVKKAYGAITHEYRERIRTANADLKGPINAPH